MNIFWKHPISDDFSNAADWSSGTVPSTLDIAKMTVAGTPYNVTINSPATVFGITTGANTTLSVASNFTAKEGTATGANRGTINIDNGGTLALFGLVNNIGTI